MKQLNEAEFVRDWHIAKALGIRYDDLFLQEYVAGINTKDGTVVVTFSPDTDKQFLELLEGYHGSNTFRIEKLIPRKDETTATES